MPPSPIPPLLPKSWFGDPIGDPTDAGRIKKAVLLGGAGIAAFFAKEGNKTIPRLSHLLTGFEIIPRKAVKIRPFAATWLLPEPFGLNPPEAFGLPPHTGSIRYQLRRFGYFGGVGVNRQLNADFEAQKLAHARERFRLGAVDPTFSDRVAARVREETQDVEPPTVGRVREIVTEELFNVRAQPLFGGRDDEDKLLLAAFAAALNDRPERDKQLLRFNSAVPSDQLLGEIQNALTDIDRLFAANPPDP